MAGMMCKSDLDGWIKLESSYVVRKWGTTKGLGEIAQNGPTQDSVLDECPPMEIPVSAIINTIECDAKAWKKWIRE